MPFFYWGQSTPFVWRHCPMDCLLLTNEIIWTNYCMNFLGASWLILNALHVLNFFQPSLRVNKLSLYFQEGNLLAHFLFSGQPMIGLSDQTINHSLVLMGELSWLPLHITVSRQVLGYLYNIQFYCVTSTIENISHELWNIIAHGLPQNTTNQVVYKQEEFISHSPIFWKMREQDRAGSVSDDGSFCGSSCLCRHMPQRVKEFSDVSFQRLCRYDLLAVQTLPCSSLSFRAWFSGRHNTHLKYAFIFAM